MKKAVYIASPYTEGDSFENVRRSVTIAERIVDMGGLPFVPLLNAFWNFLYPHEYKYWSDQMDGWVTRCDAVLRLVGKSTGADREVRIAEENGIPVFFEMVSLHKWLRDFVVK